MTLKLHRKLLLTGAAGGLGRVLRERLKENCDVLRLSDIADLGTAGEREEVIQADLADAAAVSDMVAGVDAVPGGGAVVRWSSPQRRVAPGQSIVLYDGGVVLGGGTVTR